MARKSSSGSLFSMALLAVGGYLAYENWGTISAWFANVTAPAAAAPVPVAPTSAGTIVQTGPTPAAAAAPASIVPTGPVQATPGTSAPASPTPQYVLWRPPPLSRVAPTQETPTSAGTVVATTPPPRTISSVVENRVMTRSGGYLVNNR